MIVKKKGWRDKKIDVEDLKLKVGTKRQVIWEKVAKQTRVLIEEYEESLQIQKEILVLAEKNIEEEKQSLNTTVQ